MHYDIPLFDLNFDESEEEAVLETLRSKWISCGPKCEEFERIFKTTFHTDYAYALSNCTSALHLACLVLDLEGSEVICPSLTFAATVNAIKYVGAKPVFCDITSFDNLNMDPSEIKRLITEKTKAIVVMHYAGFPCDMDEIVEIAKKNNLYIIEDACHGPLSEYQGSLLGTIGDIGCFSFFSNKNISTGEGGMLITNKSELALKVKLLRSHGMTTLSYERAKGHATAYDIVDIGYNYRMDDIRAALGIAQMKKLKDDLIARSGIRVSYLKHLETLNEMIEIPFQNEKGFVSNYIFPIVLKNSTVEKRDLVRDELHSKGIQTSVHYPAVHRFSAYKAFDITLPKTEYVSDNEITLPMYSKLSEQEIEYICNSLKEIVEEL